MKSQKYIIKCLIFVGLGFIILIFTSPATIVIPLGNLLLSNQGMELTNVKGLSIGLRSANLESGTLASEWSEIQFHNVHTFYSLMDLIQGEIDVLETDSIEIKLLSSLEKNASQEGFERQRFLNQLRSFPVRELNINAFNLLNASYSGKGSMYKNEETLKINGELVIYQDQDWKFEASLSSNNLEKFTGTMSIKSTADTSEEIAGSLFAAIISKETFSVNGSINIYPSALKSHLNFSGLYDNYTIDNEEIQINFAAEIDDLNNFPYLESLDAEVNSPENQIDIEALSTVTNISLPMTILLRKSNISSYTITASDFISSTTLLETPSTVFNNSINEVSLNCNKLDQCSLEGYLNLEIRSNEAMDRLEAIAAELSGEFSASIDESGFYLNPSELSLFAPTLRLAGWNIATNLVFSTITGSFTDNFKANAFFDSNQLSISNEKFRLLNPSISGKIEYENRYFNSTSSLQLNNQADIDLSIFHDLDSVSGSFGVEVKPFEFSTLVPSSFLFSQSILPADLLGGIVNGNASIDWRLAEDGNFTFSGPANLQLKNLRGYFNETYFIDLSTELDAAFTNSLGLKSSNKQSAAISLIDSGLPVEQISWNYEFDTTNGIYSLANLDSQILGGAIEVPQFHYDRNSLDNTLVIILNGLDLESIVTLAEYPGIEIDGRISGYLPLVIADDTITMTEGLVGALNPGGTIRYTPSKPTLQSNPSFQLVSDALSNYRYKTMDTEIYYDETGDLRMQVRLTGINPEMNGGQPINLNVNITDNIPTLLRSLRASRVITEALEESISM